jgi:hypothetical protein
VKQGMTLSSLYREEANSLVSSILEMEPITDLNHEIRLSTCDVVNIPLPNQINHVFVFKKIKSIDQF